MDGRRGARRVKLPKFARNTSRMKTRTQSRGCDRGRTQRDPLRPPSRRCRHETRRQNASVRRPLPLSRAGCSESRAAARRVRPKSWRLQKRCSVRFRAFTYFRYCKNIPSPPISCLYFRLIVHTLQKSTQRVVGKPWHGNESRRFGALHSSCAKRTCGLVRRSSRCARCITWGEHVEVLGSGRAPSPRASHRPTGRTRRSAPSVVEASEVSSFSPLLFSLMPRPRSPRRRREADRWTLGPVSRAST